MPYTITISAVSVMCNAAKLGIKLASIDRSFAIACMHYPALWINLTQRSCFNMRCQFLLWNLK